jgi:hypothetical protein
MASKASQIMSLRQLVVRFVVVVVVVRGCHRPRRTRPTARYRTMQLLSKLSAILVDFQPLIAELPAALVYW